MRHLVDKAGSSEVLATALAIDHLQMRITLVELPEAPVDKERGVELVGLDVFQEPSAFDECDGVLDNVFRAHNDDTCIWLAGHTAPIVWHFQCCQKYNTSCARVAY